jgi:hypothetical protein
MLFPHALSDISNLASLKNKPASEGKIENKSEEAPKEEKKSIMARFLPIGEEIDPKVKNEYLKFIGTWVPIFILSGVLTYARRL